MPKASKYVVAYFFLAHMEPDKKQPKDVLRCLILQLACQAPHFVSVSRVLHTRLEDRQLPPTFDKLSRALIDISRLFERVFLVLDGLDEYKDRVDLLQLIPILATGTGNISLFVTSHPQGFKDEDSLLAAAKIDLSARAEDIKTYIQGRIDGCPNAKSLLGQGTHRDKFVTDLTRCGNGMLVINPAVVMDNS